MARSFLSAFRGTDARSLAQALILLLVFSAGFDAFHAGTMASASETAGVICSATGPSNIAPGNPSDAPQGRGWSCCVIGCASIATGIVTTNDVTSPIIVWTKLSEKPLRGFSTVAGFDRPRNFGPRGPPSLV
jgi:Protein of unknown function (DUF2946)